GATSTPIGRPLANHAIRLLDRELRPMRLGAEGQIAAHGVGLARGYLARPAFTAERFVPDPLSDRQGARLYLTGDLGRYRADGELLILGRRDQQLKIRGMRIEPGEIEAALLDRPEIRAAAVRPWDRDGVTRLAAYIVLTEEGTGGRPKASLEAVPETLRDALRGRLPAAFLPDAFVVLDQLPLTPSGKLDIRALPAPDPAPERQKVVAPSGATEELLAGIWSEVLGIDRVGSQDDFHALGGHSLLATQVISRLRQAFYVELPLARLFEAPTIEQLAREVERARYGRARPKLVSTGERHQLSFAQQRLCFIDRMAPGDPVYNLPGAVHLVGPLDVPALARALVRVVARHETLRTHFTAIGTGFEQHIVEHLDPGLPIVDLSFLPESTRSAEARRVETQEVRRPFDLGRGPLLRAMLLRSSEADHEFFLTLHHVVSDGWSQGVLIQELIAFYRSERLGEPSGLPDLPVQYGDFAIWQRAWLEGGELERQARWWKDQLKDAPPSIGLPTDHPRPEELSSGGGVVRRNFDRAFMDAVRAFARRQNTSLFMTLIAAFEVVMHYASGQDDLVIGTDVANREQVELEGLIGFFVNQLVLRFSVGGDPSFREILERTRRHTLGAYAHQDLPFDKLVEAINPPRTRNRTPLFQVKFVLQNTPQPPLEVPGLTATPLMVDTRTAKFDQLWNLWERDGALQIAVEFSSDLFLAPSIERLLNLFHYTLELVQEQPDASLQELRQQLEEREKIWRRERQERWRQASRGRLKKFTKKTPALINTTQAQSIAAGRTAVESVD
ncbi:MAG: condensation domain-containing protein, partial [Acidobacteriota bacterium]